MFCFESWNFAKILHTASTEIFNYREIPLFVFPLFGKYRFRVFKRTSFLRYVFIVLLSFRILFYSRIIKKYKRNTLMLGLQISLFNYCLWLDTIIIDNFTVLCNFLDGWTYVIYNLLQLWLRGIKNMIHVCHREKCPERCSIVTLDDMLVLSSDSLTKK